MLLHSLNTIRTYLARGLMAHLLLMYLVWFPLHLQGHGAHSSTHPSSQEESSIPNDKSPLKDFCRVCDWWTLQDVADAFWNVEYTPFSVEYAYQFDTYTIPHIEVCTQLIPRAPPALG